MKTCKDCLHYEACADKFAGLKHICVDKPEKHLELDPNVENRCPHFNDRSEWAHIIRCENCKHCVFGNTVYDRYCEELNRSCYGMDFCSYGERRTTQ